jgi:hypothetical protein
MSVMGYRPDWIIIGMTSPKDEVVAIMASTELGGMQFEAEGDDWGRTHFSIVAGVKTYVFIVAPTYGEAMDSLFKHWAPQQQPHNTPELPTPSPKEILE